MSSKGVVKFNVGGIIYEVARSLLEAHPDTMVARMVSEEWQQEKLEAGIFIERDGSRFKYFLDYLRDGKISLPLSESKEAIVDDLKYYGIDPEDRVKYDNFAIPDVHTLFLNTSKLSEKALEELTDEENELSEEIKRLATELLGLQDRKREASTRVEIFRGAQVLYEEIIAEMVRYDGFPTTLKIEFEHISNEDRKEHLYFLAENQDTCFDILKVYLNSCFGVELHRLEGRFPVDSTSSPFAATSNRNNFSTQFTGFGVSDNRYTQATDNRNDYPAAQEPKIVSLYVEFIIED